MCSSLFTFAGFGAASRRHRGTSSPVEGWIPHSRHSIPPTLNQSSIINLNLNAKRFGWPRGKTNLRINRCTELAVSSIEIIVRRPQFRLLLAFHNCVEVVGDVTLPQILVPLLGGVNCRNRELRSKLNRPRHYQ